MKFEIWTQFKEGDDLNPRESRTLRKSAFKVAEKWVDGSNFVYIKKYDRDGELVAQWFWDKENRRWVETGALRRA